MTLKEFRELTKDMPEDYELIFSQTMYENRHNYCGHVYAKIVTVKIYENSKEHKIIYLNMGI